MALRLAVAYSRRGETDSAQLTFRVQDLGLGVLGFGASTSGCGVSAWAKNLE